MPDMLVKLYDLPDIRSALSKLKRRRIVIRRAMAHDVEAVTAWVRDHFSSGWASECSIAFSHQPISCYVAVRNGKLLGFGCYDCTRKDFFGPTGVDKKMRGSGIGKALFLQCLHAMAESGYAYAIIGGVGPKEFYAKAAGAVVIEGSAPGVYRDMLRKG